jgi:hypothetical protein
MTVPGLEYCQDSAWGCARMEEAQSFPIWPSSFPKSSALASPPPPRAPCFQAWQQRPAGWVEGFSSQGAASPSRHFCWKQAVELKTADSRPPRRGSGGKGGGEAEVLLLPHSPPPDRLRKAQTTKDAPLPPPPSRRPFLPWSQLPQAD